MWSSPPPMGQEVQLHREVGPAVPTCTDAHNGGPEHLGEVIVARPRDVRLFTLPGS